MGGEIKGRFPERIFSDELIEIFSDVVKCNFFTETIPSDVENSSIFALTLQWLTYRVFLEGLGVDRRRELLLEMVRSNYVVEELVRSIKSFANMSEQTDSYLIVANAYEYKIFCNAWNFILGPVEWAGEEYPNWDELSPETSKMISEAKASEQHFIQLAQESIDPTLSS